MDRHARTAFLLSSILAFSVSTDVFSQRRDALFPNYSESTPVQLKKVPDSITFAGETIRFDRTDMRERLDRELIAFTYSHSTSILMLKRAGRFFPQVEPILKSYGLPDDLKYLMVIESNLDPQSVSSAGAAGLWQFTAATARQYGLEVNSNVDERYNTAKATDAACRYLKAAYAKYGEWLTVAASYNAGQAGISSKLEKQHRKNATDLWLPNETSRYMFRLLVAKLMFQHPEEFGFRLESDDIYPFIPAKDTICVTEPVPDLVEFAERYGISFYQLKQANLWLRESQLNNASHRRYEIIIPDVK